MKFDWALALLWSIFEIGAEVSTEPRMERTDGTWKANPSIIGLRMSGDKFVAMMELVEKGLAVTEQPEVEK